MACTVDKFINYWQSIDNTYSFERDIVRQVIQDKSLFSNNIHLMMYKMLARYKDILLGHVTNKDSEINILSTASFVENCSTFDDINFNLLIESTCIKDCTLTA